VVNPLAVTAGLRPATGSVVRFDGVAVRFPHLKRRPLQIGYKLLHYRFINGVQGPSTESEKDVFGDSIKKLLVNYS
jgi:hypothetical protein